MTRLVSAEEARGLLEGATSGPMSAAADANGNGLIWCVRDDRGVRVALLGANDGADAGLLAAAPDLAATVIALSDELAAADSLAMSWSTLAATMSNERDRLRDILACERGEQAPEGWRWTSTAVCERGLRNQPGYASIARGSVRPGLLPWSWYAGGKHGDENTALEAIEAADRAAAPK